MPKRSRSYKVGLNERLQDPNEALLYLQVALEESVGDFLVALRNVVEARGFSRVAESAELDRVNLYRMLSRHGNPRLTSLTALLRTLGMNLTVQFEPEHASCEEQSPENIAETV